MRLLLSALFHSLLMHSVSFLLTVMPPLYRRCHIKGDRTWLDTAHFISSACVHFMLTFLVLLCPHLLITLNVVQGKSHLPSTFQPWWVKMIMVCVCVARFYIRMVLWTTDCWDCCSKNTLTFIGNVVSAKVITPWPADDYVTSHDGILWWCSMLLGRVVCPHLLIPWWSLTMMFYYGAQHWCPTMVSHDGVQR